MWDRHYNVVADVLLELRFFLLWCGVNDFDHIIARILSDFVQMVFHSRQYAQFGDPGVIVHVNHDSCRVSVSHTGASYSHQEVYDFFGRQVFYFNSWFSIKSLQKISFLGFLIFFIPTKACPLFLFFN